MHITNYMNGIGEHYTQAGRPLAKAHAVQQYPWQQSSCYDASVLQSYLDDARTIIKSTTHLCTLLFTFQQNNYRFRPWSGALLKQPELANQPILLHLTCNCSFYLLIDIFYVAVVVLFYYIFRLT